MNREEADKVLNAIDFKNGDNIVIINKNVYDKMKNEKQQLISFLEDRIKILSQMTAQFINIGDKVTSIPEIKIEVLQEILDFVNKGDKDE